jgi:hypothetical protein
VSLLLVGLVGQKEQQRQQRAEAEKRVASSHEKRGRPIAPPALTVQTTYNCYDMSVLFAMGICHLPLYLYVYAYRHIGIQQTHTLQYQWTYSEQRTTTLPPVSTAYSTTLTFPALLLANLLLACACLCTVLNRLYY